MQKTMIFRTLTGIIFSLMWLGLSDYNLANSPSIHFISEIKGKVKLKRSQWKNYHKAQVGDLLKSSDKLQLDLGASATIMCSNLSFWNLHGNSIIRVSDGCPSGTLTRIRPDATRITPRAPNETIPYIISPRNTSLLTNHPIIRWNPVSGATQYTVKLLSLGAEHWQLKTDNTQIKFPGIPLFETNEYYFFVIEAKKNDQSISSDQEEGVNILFQQLDKTKSQSIRIKTDQIKQQNLTRDLEVLTLAYLYQSYNLNAEAIELLEELVKESSQITAVYQLLGDLYRQVGLSRLSERYYLIALELAEKSENIEGKADAKVGLGEASYSLGKQEKSIEFLKEAKEDYRILGDDERIRELDRLIDLISR